MYSENKYYIETPVTGLGDAITGWCKWRPDDYWAFGTWEETKHIRDVFSSLEEAQKAAKEYDLDVYRIIEDKHTVSVVDSKYS